MPGLLRAAALVSGAGAATLGYGVLVERRLFAVRRFDVPVLAPGQAPLTVLHLSDLHIVAGQTRKIEFVRSLARFEPDLVINTGDTFSSVDALDAVLHAFEPLSRFPGVFVPGNNDYYQPKPKNPVLYFRPQHGAPDRVPMPWEKFAAAIAERTGWLDLTHRRETLDIGGRPVALAGTDDPHLRRADYSLIAGPADPDAVARIGAMHSPEPFVLSRFADDGYDLVLAGHTHGGQIRVPFGPAIVTNCGIERNRARWLHPWDERMYFHVSAGAGESPYAPIRIACRPEATLLRLVAR